MMRLADRLLNRVAQKVTVDAGCSNYTYCQNHVKWLRQCCLDEGCTYVRIGTC
ncbi:hypothetical protein ACIBSV_01955 [Embleya sp. NPDC050154]|uniref:hypothetical protein n=1 Tax=unclassified Embleya TaxID=2699296 RepID=UPI002F9189DE|nr:hypothetical protein OG948_46190 [Embleya sp. NBC_00888]